MRIKIGLIVLICVLIFVLTWLIDPRIIDNVNEVIPQSTTTSTTTLPENFKWMKAKEIKSYCGTPCTESEIRKLWSMEYEIKEIRSPFWITGLTEICSDGGATYYILANFTTNNLILDGCIFEETTDIPTAENRSTYFEEMQGSGYRRCKCQDGECQLTQFVLCEGYNCREWTQEEVEKNNICARYDRETEEVRKNYTTISIKTFSPLNLKQIPVVFGTGRIIDVSNVEYDKDLKATWQSDKFELKDDGSFNIDLKCNYLSQDPVDLEYVSSNILMRIGATRRLNSGNFSHSALTNLYSIENHAPDPNNSKYFFVKNQQGSFSFPLNISGEELYALDVQISWVRTFRDSKGNVYYQWMKANNDVWHGKKLEVNKVYTNESGNFLVYNPIAAGKGYVSYPDLPVSII